MTGTAGSTAPAAPAATGLSPLSGVLLMIATGATDAYVFLVHGHVFAQAMTGNLVLIAVGVVEPGIVAFWHPLTAYLAFLAGVSATWLWRRSTSCITLYLQVGLLLIAGFLPPSFPSIVVVAAIAFASGLQIASFTRVGDAALSTTVMTTNSMRALNAFWSAVTRRRADDVGQARAYGAALGGFVAGAFLSAGAAHLLQQRAGWVIAACYAAALISHQIRVRRSPS